MTLREPLSLGSPPALPKRVRGPADCCQSGLVLTGHGRHLDFLARHLPRQLSRVTVGLPCDEYLRALALPRQRQ
jgi:hypothetical protein